MLSKHLVSGFYYDCDKVFTPNPDLSHFERLGYEEGLKTIFKNLWPIILIGFISQFLNITLNNVNSNVLISMSTRS